jgi:hypothetical protein
MKRKRNGKIRKVGEVGREGEHKRSKEDGCRD